MVTLAASAYFLTCCKSVIYSKSNVCIETPKFVNLLNYPLIQAFESQKLGCPLHERLSDHCLKPFTTCSDGRAWSLDRDQQRKHFLDIINGRVPLCSLKDHNSKDKNVYEIEIKDEEKTKVNDPPKVKEPWKIKKVEDPSEAHKVIPKIEEPWKALPKVEELNKTKELPKVEELNKTKELPKVEELNKTKELPKVEELNKTKELPKVIESPIVEEPLGQLPDVFELPKDVEQPKVDKPPIVDESINPLKAKELPKVDEPLKNIKLSDADEPPTLDGSPNSDEIVKIQESAKVLDPQNVKDSSNIEDLPKVQDSSKIEEKVGKLPKINENDDSLPLEEEERIPSEIEPLNVVVKEMTDRKEIGSVESESPKASFPTGSLVDPEGERATATDLSRGFSSLSDLKKLDSNIDPDKKHEAVVDLQERTTSPTTRTPPPNKSDGEIEQLTDEMLAKLNRNIENLEMTFDTFIKKNRDFIQHLLEGVNYEAEKKKALEHDYDKIKHENDVLRTNNEYLKMVNAKQLELFKNELDKAVGENKAAYSKKINKMEIQIEKDQDKIKHYKMTVLKYKEVMDKGDEKVLQLEDDIEKLKKTETTLLKNYVKILNFLEDVKKQLNSDDSRGGRLPKTSISTISAKEIDPNLKDVMKSALTNGLESLNVRDLSILHDAIQNLNDHLCHQNEIHGINLPLSITKFRMTYEDERFDDYMNKGFKDYDTASNLSIYPSRHRTDGYTG